VPSTRAPAVVLGVDPGLTRCGLGVVSGPPGRPVHVRHDCVTTPSDLPLEQRLVRLHAGVVDAIATHRPVLVAVERVLFSRNVRTAMGTGQAAGVAMLAAAQAGLPVVQLTPTDVKASVAGDGGADKDGVARMVVAQLGLAATPRPADAADALAVALAALVRMRTTAAGRRGPDRAGGRPTAPAGSWEQVVAERGLTVAGGTGARDAAARPGGRA
jgi:crossover junction endodeoxyribonuclease RuvC